MDRTVKLGLEFTPVSVSAGDTIFLGENMYYQFATQQDGSDAISRNSPVNFPSGGVVYVKGATENSFITISDLFKVGV